MSGINTKYATGYTTPLLVADTVATSGGSNDSIASMTTTVVGGETVNVSAALEIQSTEGALLVPRMTTVERDAIVAPYNGMVLYDTTTDLMNFYVGGAWQTFGGGGGPVSGPASSTDNAVVRWNGTSGDNIQDSVVIVADTTGNMTGVGSIAADLTGVGALATPTYTFTGDLNTGMWHSAADVLDFSAGGVQAFQLNTVASGVDYLAVYPSATNAGNAALQPRIQALGSDAAVDVAVSGRGTAGFAILPSSTAVAASAKFWNGAGTFYTSLNAGVNTANLALTLPIVDATANAAANEVASAAAVQTDCAGALTFSNQLQRYTSVTIPTASVLSMYTTGIEVIAAPGAGKSIIVHAMALELNYNSAQYANGGTIYLTYGNTGHGTDYATLVTGIDAAAITGNADFTAYTLGSLNTTAGLATATTSNAAICITNATALFITGDSDLKVHVWYSIITNV